MCTRGSENSVSLSASSRKPRGCTTSLPRFGFGDGIDRRADAEQPARSRAPRPCRPRCRAAARRTPAAAPPRRRPSLDGAPARAASRRAFASSRRAAPADPRAARRRSGRCGRARALLQQLAGLRRADVQRARVHGHRVGVLPQQLDRRPRADVHAVHVAVLARAARRSGWRRFSAGRSAPGRAATTSAPSSHSAKRTALLPPRAAPHRRRTCHLTVAAPHLLELRGDAARAASV